MAKDLFSSHPPFTPPKSEEDRLTWLRLIRSARVGPTTFHRLMAEHGTAAAALDALPAIARAAGASDYAPCARDAAEREIDLARAKGARMLCFGTDAYPATLASIADAPPVLWCIGQRAPILRPMVALVGARNASSLGTRTARALAEGLGHEGFAIVSGLARGIDAAAHHGSLKSGTIAVMAGGVDVIYPTENAVLAAAIADQGLRLSEQPMSVHPQARHFPPRNRIISGLALAVVVVEAAEKSGSLITARDALDQGREIMAVPGHPVDGRAGGCNRLLREGATLVRHVEDVLEVLRRLQDRPAPATQQPPVAENPAPATGQPLEQRILDLLGPSPVAEDQIIRDLALSAAQISPALVMLELQGTVRRHPGGLVSRA
jgi:DNA processing protein